MRGLLIKDLLSTVKQMRLFLLMFLVFLCIPGFSGVSFAMILMAMLPVTALAYDERSKWPELAATMPYRPIDFVLSKYLLGILLMLCGMVLQMIVQLLRIEASSSMGTMLMVALLLMDISLPSVFWFGTEKGRYVVFLGAGVLAMGATGLNMESLLPFHQQPFLMVGILILVTVLSVALSVAGEKRKRK